MKVDADEDGVGGDECGGLFALPGCDEVEGRRAAEAKGL